MPFSRFHITLECPGQTNGWTELLYQYRPLQKLLLVLNCRDCRVFESNQYLLLLLMQNLASKILCIFVTGGAYALRPLFVYATGRAS